MMTMAEFTKMMRDRLQEGTPPIPMILICPGCAHQHVDAPDKYAKKQPDGTFTHWTNPPHKSHLCHNCKTVWRPADVPTTGVLTIKTRGANDTMVYT